MAYTRVVSVSAVVPVPALVLVLVPASASVRRRVAGPVSDSILDASYTSQILQSIGSLPPVFVQVTKSPWRCRVVKRARRRV